MYTYIMCVYVCLLWVQSLWRTLTNTLLILSFRGTTFHPHSQHSCHPGVILNTSFPTLTFPFQLS